MEFWLGVEMLMKISIAAVLGLIIGLERELTHKPLGLKTSLVISIVSCLLTIVSIESSYSFHESTGVMIQMDPLRLAAQIVSGVGFLGAGVILRRSNEQLSGLTTAAIIWGTAGIGIAVGAGFYIEAIFAVSLLLISVQIIPYYIFTYGPKRLRHKELTFRIKVNQQAGIEAVITELEHQKYIIIKSRIKDMNGENMHLLEIKVRVPSDQTLPVIYNAIKKIEYVSTVEIIE
ncbi:MgtC/SapB family protein [Psychrobacter sp. AOP22-C1-22]|uniref:MgtC/SapB family protein n=2 Tax=Psychrobacter TaxID=497 RepID=UPI00178892A2|nr:MULTISPECIES: MgtC/SapB family protein [unclassified Psychrobacter]MBE0407722.1 MgtC/SapB family protein [Psychrobacter sp. FME6]MBE0446072.1 MgtC/SapB family protein [Psychrobacter sp. FME5]MDN5890761.1 MgtC/SapB family protein [Psychrobacter sp.]